MTLAGSDLSLTDRGDVGVESTAQIECVAPGTAGAVRLPMADAKIRYALPRGVTSFIIHLDAPGQQRCFTLVNENRVARGKLSIAVSDERLDADNPNWRTVDGAIPFRQKKLFALSLLGVEAKFVKLTFLVEAPEKITSCLGAGQPTNRFTLQPLARTGML